MARWIPYILLVAAACISLFARFYNVLPGDEPLLEWFQSWRHPAVTSYMEAVSFFGSRWFIGGLAGFVVIGLFAAGRRKDGFAATGIIGILFLSPLLKVLVDRPRPPFDIASITDPSSGSSFPSGHAFNSFVLFAFLIFLVTILVSTTWIRRAAQIFLVVLILAIGVSRIYLNAHWPSDVLGAYLLGSFFLVLLLRVYKAEAVIAASQ